MTVCPGTGTFCRDGGAEHGLARINSKDDTVPGSVGKVWRSGDVNDRRHEAFASLANSNHADTVDFSVHGFDRGRRACPRLRSIDTALGPELLERRPQGAGFRTPAAAFAGGSSSRRTGVVRRNERPAAVCGSARGTAVSRSRRWPCMVNHVCRASSRRAVVLRSFVSSVERCRTFTSSAA